MPREWGSQKEMFSYVDECTYIGIDPGENGAVVYLTNDAIGIDKVNGVTDKELWEAFKLWTGLKCFACIELQTPRPTTIPDGKSGWRQTILASTCILYGRYQQARSFLIAAQIPFEDVPPKRWQKGLNIPPKAKGMKDTEWKNVLKSKAQQLFPEEKVTLANADALLLAEYCRRKQEGKL